MSIFQVEVEGQIFNLSQQDLNDSKTIENLLQYKTIVSPILIGVPLDQWQDYLRFLQDNEPTIGALKVIDYLDNLQQARRWFILAHDEIQDRDNNLSPQQVKQITVDDINRYTQFIPKQIVPFYFLDNIEDMIPRFEEMGKKSLSNMHIIHIFTAFYSSHIYNVYQHISKIQYFSELHQEDIDLFTNLNFIVSTENNTYMDASRILHIYDNIRLSGVSKISPRIAAYYKDIKVYEYNGDLFMCPNRFPYLLYNRPRNSLQELPFLSCSIVKDNYEPINVYNPQTHYRPYPHQGFQTAITIADYQLISYTQPSRYGKDYYFYLPYEYDPIAKIVYAFSL